MSQLLFAKMSDNYRFACIEYRVLGIWPNKFDFQQMTSLWFYFDDNRMHMIFEIGDLMSEQERFTNKENIDNRNPWPW